MKSRNITFIAIISLTILFACRSYVQVIKTESELPVNNEGYYLFENDTLRIMYSFWYPNGLMSFSIYNKTNKPLYIDWKKSAYIDNSVKLDYWRDESIIEQNGVYGKYTTNNYNDFFFGNSSSKISNSERITFIPPRSNFFKSKFIILPSSGLQLNNNIEAKEEPLKNKPKRNTTIYSQTFSKKESPLIFRNYLTFSFSEEFKEEFYVDNEFFIQKILEMNKNHFEYNKYDSTLIIPTKIWGEDNKALVFCDYKSQTSFYIRMTSSKSVEYRRAYKKQ